MRSRSLALATLSLAAGARTFAAVTTEPTAEQAAFFESKIRPILADNCYKCHSVEKGKSKGGLTLDTREGVLKGGEDGPAIKPGNPADSPLIKAINYEDKDLQMPPSKDGGKLADAQIAALLIALRMKGETVEEIVGFAEAIRAAGFSRVSWQSLSGGIVALHSGWRL